MLAFAKTDIGLVRPINEDSFACIPPNFYMVADGMGGHLAGEIASQIAVETVKNYIFENMDRANSCEHLLEKAIVEANKQILTKANSDDSYKGMGTTITSALINDDTVVWAHIGDSRLYLVRNNMLTQLTRDHSLVWELLENGSINKSEAINHPQKNVLTRAVGIEDNIKVELGSIKLFPNDLLLLCTDGLTNMLKSEVLIDILTQDIDIEDIVNILVSSALDEGGTDNITTILVKY